MKNTSTIVNRVWATKGKKYNKMYTYIPSQVARDDQFPFKFGDKVTINIDPVRKCLIIEKLIDKVNEREVKPNPNPNTVNKQNKEVEMTEKGQDEIKKNTVEPQDTLEARRQKWWDKKEIYKYIIKAGGLEKSNSLVMYQRNADIFKSHEDCKVWLRNKLKTLNEKASSKEGLKQLQYQTQMILCPECKGKNILISKTSTERKCTHCGFKIKKENYEFVNEKTAQMQGRGVP